MDLSTMNDRVVTMHRTLNAPLSLVWEAWTKAEHIANWWGPNGMKSEVEELDFREGGSWKYTMMMPNGQPFSSFGVFSEIVHEERIVTSANFPPMTENVILHMVFEAKGDQTSFTFSVIHDTPEYKDAQVKMGFENGWGSQFTRLNDYLESAKA